MGLIDDTITAINKGDPLFLPEDPSKPNEEAIFTSLVGPTKVRCLPNKIEASRNSVVAFEYNGPQFATIREAIITQYGSFKNSVKTQLETDMAEKASA